MSASMVERVRDFVAYHPEVRKAVYRLLKTPLFTHNPFYSWLFLRNTRKKIQELEKCPQAMEFEVTNHCNVECGFCPHPTMERSKGIMDLDLYKRLIDECVQMGVFSVNLTGFGEPLLDPFLAERIKYAKDQGIPYVQITTTTYLLDEAKAKSLIESGLDDLFVSLDAATSETYNKVRKIKGVKADGPNFETVVSNFKNLVKLKKDRGAEKPRVRLRFLQLDSNSEEIKDFITKYKHSADDLAVWFNVHSWGGKMDAAKPEGIFFPCRSPWDGMTIRWDGRVSLCCLDYEGKVITGDVRESSLMEVWQGEELRELRRLHLSGQAGQISICKDCHVATHLTNPWWC